MCRMIRHKEIDLLSAIIYYERNLTYNLTET